MLCHSRWRSSLRGCGHYCAAKVEADPKNGDRISKDKRHHRHAQTGPRMPAAHHGPYWKRAHHDWRFWVAVFFIFAALAVYIMSVDLSLVPRHESQAPSIQTK